MSQAGRMAVAGRTLGAALAAVAVACSLAACATSAGSDRTAALGERANVHLQLATGYYQQGQWNIALEEAGKALAAAPGMADAYSVRALSQTELGRLPQADADFHQALQLAPGNPEFANNYGWFLCRSGHAGQALGYFDKAAADPAYRAPAKALGNAGACSLKAGDEAAAERYFLRALQFDGAQANGNAQLARLYARRGDAASARRHLALLDGHPDADAPSLWLAIKAGHSLQARMEVSKLGAQLGQRYPASPEYAAYRLGVFDE